MFKRCTLFGAVSVGSLIAVGKFKMNESVFMTNFIAQIKILAEPKFIMYTVHFTIVH